MSLSTPLSLLTSTLFLATTSLHVLYAPPTPICCQFLESTKPLVPIVSELLPPHYRTYSCLAFTLVHHHSHSIVFLKPSVLTRPSVPLVAETRCLWLTLCTLKDFIHLITYLLTSLTHTQLYTHRQF